MTARDALAGFHEQLCGKVLRLVCGKAVDRKNMCPRADPLQDFASAHTTVIAAGTVGIGGTEADLRNQHGSTAFVYRGVAIRACLIARSRGSPCGKLRMSGAAYAGKLAR